MTKSSGDDGILPSTFSDSRQPWHTETFGSRKFMDATTNVPNVGCGLAGFGSFCVNNLLVTVGVGAELALLALPFLRWVALSPLVPLFSGNPTFAKVVKFVLFCFLCHFRNCAKVEGNGNGV